MAQMIEAAYLAGFEPSSALLLPEFFDFQEKCGFRNVISEAFRWDKSMDGYKFWKEKDREYRQFLEKE